ncbi:MAG: methyltransferase domain-containing protein [Candidatus Azobacteroides sp.]|nr:methyltransferase domain-containing protein [Candidatus Azobacteroides sp.]
MRKDQYPYFEGKSLYGDNFSPEEIEQWYCTEAEAFANMYGMKINNGQLYEFHHLNTLYGYRYLQNQETFHHALGFGASWGYEFLPIIDKIEKLTIIESSIQTRSLKIGEKLIPEYQSPHKDGQIEFPDHSFDLITCFDALHHIPNVSFVLKELFRVLQPDGYILLREPIHSMGDWRNKRSGLTANERGIPKDYLLKIINQNGMDIVQKHYYYCMTSFFKRTFPKMNADSWPYLYFDRFLSSLLAFNIHYHPINKMQRISPTSIFYVLRKPI